MTTTIKHLPSCGALRRPGSPSRRLTDADCTCGSMNRIIGRAALKSYQKLGDAMEVLDQEVPENCPEVDAIYRQMQSACRDLRPLFERVGLTSRTDLREAKLTKQEREIVNMPADEKEG